MNDRNSIEHWQSAYRESSAKFIGAKLPWLAQTRNEALEQLVGSGLPTRRDEEWKYTGIAPIEKDIASVALQPGTVDAKSLQPYLLADTPSHVLVFIDGHYSASLSQIQSLPSGIVLDSLSNLLLNDADRLEPHLRGNSGDRWFAAMNRALTTDGAYLELDRGVELEEPVHLLFVASNSCGHTAIQPRNILIANANSKATVIEHYVGLGDKPYLTNTVTEVITSTGAEITHYKVQQETDRGYHVGSLLTRQTGDSRLDSHSISLGGRIVRNDIYSRLEAEHAHCTLNGLFLGSNRQHIDNYTWVDHLVPNGTSSEFYKGILDHHARGVFNGRVRVQPDAQQTEAMQANKNLLLSRDAEIDTKPQLEIYADDVKCSHGATVGELDPKSVFYLRSRGIDEAAARSLLTFAFAGDLLRHIVLIPLRNRLEEIVIARLPEGETVKELI